MGPPWPVLRTYEGEHLTRVAMPLGGIGTGSVSLGGRGNLRDWEVMNRPAKGWVPGPSRAGSPFLMLRCQRRGAAPVTRLLEGPVPLTEYEGASGSPAPNHGFPRFARCTFATAYPLASVRLADPDVPLEARLEAFNPLIPADAEASGIPVAILRCVVRNRGTAPVSASLCLSLPNFVGRDGTEGECRGNRNTFRDQSGVRGLFLDSTGVPRHAPQWGTLALATTARSGLSHRTAWKRAGWGTSALDFWDDFHGDGRLEEREAEGEAMPIASLAVSLTAAPGTCRAVTFLIGWHFPNRPTWTPCDPAGACGDDIVGNWYATRYADAWDAVARTATDLRRLEAETVRFVAAFCASDLPAAAKEAALFNLSTLRTQSCFRTADGSLFGWEGTGDHAGCCLGSCTHVWNYEQATPFLFADLARSMREVEFLHATDPDTGLMSFRVHLPLGRARAFGKAAADGQLGCIVKVYREWQLSGDEDWLRRLWPRVRKALEFCWIPGGWDADRDGVMEGCQHNTMDVEYYGPNPQMGAWYLAALRAAEEMARHLGEEAFAADCRRLFAAGSAWVDAHLFNGEYYEHEVRPPASAEVAPALRLGAGAADPTRPDYQLGSGCLVDQLVGQLAAHVTGLGYLLDRQRVGRALRSISRHNHRASLRGHANVMRSYALGAEAALLMASYPRGRPANPFPYFTEVMTGFEYTAAIGMLYEGQTRAGLRHIAEVRARYDGRRRNPFDEAECGHHYARAMVAWAALLAWSGFHYGAVTGTMAFADRAGRHFWSTGWAWGTCRVRPGRRSTAIELQVLGGRVALEGLALGAGGVHPLGRRRVLRAGQSLACRVVQRGGEATLRKAVS